MELTASTTKEALMYAAGELFAEYGVDGTSIRAIADKCQANIAAVNYHYGTKENLYLALIRHVLGKTRCYRAGELLETKDEWSHDPYKCAEAVYQVVEEHTRQYLAGVHPRWYGRIFMRMMLHPTPAVWEVIEELIMPDFDALCEVLRCCRAGMSAEEAELWANSLMGQMTHFIFAEDFLSMIPRGHKFDSVFQRNILHHVSLLLIRGLELPLPAFLQEGNAHA